MRLTPGHRLVNLGKGGEPGRALQFRRELVRAGHLGAEVWGAGPWG